MENNNKEKNNKVLAVAALLVAIVGLSIGFAAYSGTLTIKSGATVTPDKDTFSIDFTNTPDGVDPDPIIPEVYPEGVKADPAIIDNTDNPTVSGLKAYFTAPGQKVSYTLYAYNNGQYSTYLKNILFKNSQDLITHNYCPNYITTKSRQCRKVLPAFLFCFTLAWYFFVYGLFIFIFAWFGF